MFTLRLIPVVPFFLVNLLMGLSTIGVRTYYWVSQLGMLAATVVYVNAGTQLARIMSREDTEVSELVRQAFERDGIEVLTDHSAVRCGACGAAARVWPGSIGH